MFKSTKKDNEGRSASDKLISIELKEENFKDMPLESLLAIQEQVGTKTFSKTILTGEERSNNVEIHSDFKRRNKNRPQEVPMIRGPARRTYNLDIKETKPKVAVTRDPRFDDLSGKLDILAWKKNYSFLKQKREKEKKILEKEMKQTNDSEKSKHIKTTISRMENQERETEKMIKELKLKKQFREEAISSLKAGKAPKFISKKARNLTLKTAQYEILKKENRLDKYLIRKEKKLRTKEFKKL